MTPFDGLSKADLYRLFDKLLPRNFLHVALPPNLVKFTQLARFMAERAYDLFLASAPDDVCACPSGIAVWALTPLDMPEPLVLLCAVRSRADTVSPRPEQRLQAVPARLPVRRQGHGAGVPSFCAHRYGSAGTVHIRET